MMVCCAFLLGLRVQRAEHAGVKWSENCVRERVFVWGIKGLSWSCAAEWLRAEGGL